MRGAVWLMYHGVAGVGEPLVPGDNYMLSASVFTEHLDAVAASGRRVMGAEEWLAEPSDEAVVITFDDGEASQFDNALPRVRERGWACVLFVTWDFMDKRGLRAAVQDAAAGGVEIGVHGMTHRPLTNLSVADARWELEESRKRLEDLIGKRVVSASAPGGAWRSGWASVAAAAGLRLMCTSQPGVNRLTTNPFFLRRVTIRGGMGPEHVARFCDGLVATELVRSGALRATRQVAGDDLYKRINVWYGHARGLAKRTS